MKNLVLIVAAMFVVGSSLPIDQKTNAQEDTAAVSAYDTTVPEMPVAETPAEESPAVESKAASSSHRVARRPVARAAGRVVTAPFRIVGRVAKGVGQRVRNRVNNRVSRRAARGNQFASRRLYRRQAAGKA